MENNENLKVDGDESPMEFDEFGQILPVEKQQ